MLFDKVVDPDTLRMTPSGFSVGVRLPWYRALPLSCVSINLLTIDGSLVEPGKIRFLINGNNYSLDDLSDKMEETWFSVDTATLQITGHILAENSEHEVEAEVEVRPPYIKNLRRVGRATKTMKVRK